MTLKKDAVCSKCWHPYTRVYGVKTRKTEQEYQAPGSHCVGHSMTLPADRTFMAQEQDTTNFGRKVFMCFVMCLCKTALNHSQYAVQQMHFVIEQTWHR